MPQNHLISQKLILTVIIAFASSILIIIIAKYSFLSPLFSQFEFALRDMRSEYRAITLDRSFTDAVIVDIDNRSIGKLGKMSGWPREYFGDVIDFVNEGQAGAVLFDIIFDRGLYPAGDSIFAQSIENAGNIFFSLSFTETDSENFLYAMPEEPPEFMSEPFYYTLREKAEHKFWTKPRLGNDFFDFINRAAGVGFANSSPDRDGVIRSAELLLDFNGHFYPALTMSVLMKILDVQPDGITLGDDNDLVLITGSGESIGIPLADDGRFLIDYYGTFQTIRYISFYDVLERRVPAEFFTGKMVYIGASAPGLSDLKSVPVQRKFPGVEIHANILANIVDGSYIYDMDETLSFFAVLILCLIASFTGMYLKTWQSLLVLVFVSAGYVLTSFQYFANHGVFTEIVTTESGQFLSYLGIIIYKYLSEERDKRFIKDAFSHFVDTDVIREIIENPAKLKLGGERRELTILFSDIRDFTTISEKMAPENLSKFLNVYLTEMTNIVFQHGGLLDKYIGDAVVSLFGVPVFRKDHAVRGAKAAIDMIQAVEKIKVKFKNTPMEDLSIGVGVNSGICSVGNMGSDFRFEYTAIGDEMNLGSRLEGLNKFYGTKIIIASATAKELDQSYKKRELDFVQVKGKSEPVGIWELMPPDTVFPEEAIVYYQRGLISYVAQDWNSSAEMFEKVAQIVPSDKPAQIMLKRIIYLRDNPPEKDWAGVWIFDAK